MLSDLSIADAMYHDAGHYHLFSGGWDAEQFTSLGPVGGHSGRHPIALGHHVFQNVVAIRCGGEEVLERLLLTFAVRTKAWRRIVGNEIGGQELVDHRGIPPSIYSFE